MYGPDNQAMHQSRDICAVENIRRVRQQKQQFFFRFTYIFLFQRRPRRINYNRDPVKSSLGELFIDPACPNTRARALAHTY